MKRTVLVTGGTGSVGQALVSRFTAEGYEVLFTYHADHDGAARLAGITGALSVQLDSAQVDLTSLPDTDIDVLVNNAGVNISSVVSHEVTTTDWLATLATNLTFPFLLVRRYLPGMMRRHWGRIINTSSIYGLRAVEQNLPYTVSKHGLAGLTKTVAREYAPFGVTCNEICPGPIASQLMQRIAARESDGSPAAVKAYLAAVAEEIPARRMATPEDIASLAAFLASDGASYVNGVSIPIDGAMIA